MSRTVIKNINILQISVDFNYSCGVSKHVYSLLKGLQENQSYRLLFITNGGDALDKLNDINIKPVIFNFSKGLKNIFYIYSNLKILKRFCFENKVDIIHTHHRYPELLAYIISKGTGIKTITTVHSLVKGKKKFSFNSDIIIAVSNSVKNLLRNYYKIPDEKITMLYNFLEVFNSNEQSFDFNYRAKLGIPEEDSIILFLGRITKIKGVDLLIKAFKVIKQNNKNVSLLIAGQVYDKSIGRLLNNLPKGIKLLNIVKDTYPYYIIADLVVLPSRMDPFPYVMLEAGIMRKPFIGSRTGGIAEFIDDKINGLLFEPGNVEELINKIEFIIDYPENAKNMAENLQRKVIQECSVDKYFFKLDKIYDKLIAENNG